MDLDCHEARLAAVNLLPPTGWIFGRENSRSAHWIYRTDQPHDRAEEKYCDLNGNALVELRGTGGQTVFPPSVHQETGEAITWERFDLPAIVALADLRRAVEEIAVVALLARHWPVQGKRQNCYLALIGGLLRAQWRGERVWRLVDVGGGDQ